jgi:hypothetical protein
MRRLRDDATVAYFEERGLQPARVSHRFDGTVELTWHVDDCDERYVRLTSSAHGEDHVLVARDLRAVDACVLDDRREIFDWVSSRLVLLAAASRGQQRGVEARGEAT